MMIHLLTCLARPGRELCGVGQNFETLLIPAAANHFNNEVVGLNDQFRFLNDVLVEHLLEIELAQARPRSARQFTF